MPFAFLLAIEEHDSLKFDAVVVDEGQDFSPEMWMSLEALLKDETSKLFVFSDTSRTSIQRKTMYLIYDRHSCSKQTVETQNKYTREPMRPMKAHQFCRLILMVKKLKFSMTNLFLLNRIISCLCLMTCVLQGMLRLQTLLSLWPIRPIMRNTSNCCARRPKDLTL